MPDLIGRELGPYRVLEQLGVGGMATVYKAYHAAMDRYVAIKVLPEHLAREAGFRARFEREARTIARLEHRHILPVYDVAEDDGVPYLVMRFTDGGDLADLIAAGGLTTARAAELVAQVADALAYAHSLGVIHRDVKPANVLIGRDGDALLSDFGIAKIYSDTSQLTGEGMMVGTPAYMAPEQLRGQAVDARTDIYSLGVVLYQALTGECPFIAETPLAVALMHIHNPLRPPRQLNPAIPEPIERVVLRALAKNPDDRFQDCVVFARALRAAVAAPAAEPGRPATLTLPELEMMHIHKTGALIRAAVRLGASCGKPLAAAEAERLDRFAKCVGLAFQVVDDVLDAEASTATLGKTAGKDAVQNKPTYVSLLGIAEAKRKAAELRAEAKQALERFGARGARLSDLTDYIAERSF